MTDEPQNTEETQEAFEARMAEQEAAEQAEAAPEEYIEFVGQEPYGTEFTGQHSVDRKHMKEYHNVDLGAKEIVWTKGGNGRFLVPVGDMSPEAAAVLEADPLFRRVTA